MGSVSGQWAASGLRDPIRQDDQENGTEEVRHMFRSVLIPLDGSSFSERALPLAEMVGRAEGTSLHLVSVDDGGGGKEEYLAGVAGRLGDAGVAADYTVLDGKIVDALESHAKQVEADLIVMTTHGRSGFERLRLGSVAEGLVTRGVAPMLLFHPETEGSTSIPDSIKRVVVALDHSPFAQSILAPVENLGRSVGVKSYTLVHVAEGKGAAGKAGWTPLAAVQARANERVGPIRDRLGAEGAEVDIQVVMASEPGDGIIGIARDQGADLIAMTTHGMTGLRPTLVGSVAADVLRKWHGLLLLRRPEE
jgi:nucleotide-binding universal stress UspA family protein